MIRRRDSLIPSTSRHFLIFLAPYSLTFKKKTLNLFFELIFWHRFDGLVVIAGAGNVQPATHGWNAVFILVSSDYLPFCAIITAASFKISTCISSSLSRFLRAISLRCSSVSLSMGLNELVVSDCSKVEGVKSYSLINSLRFLPAL